MQTNRMSALTASAACFDPSLVAGALLSLALLTGCAALTPLNTKLESARADFQLAQKNEDVFLLAGRELGDAEEALDDANRAWRWHASKARVDVLADVVTQRTTVARQTAAVRLVEVRRVSRELEGPR